MLLLATALLISQGPSADLRWSKLPLRVAQQLPVSSVHPGAAVRLFSDQGLALGTTPADSIQSLLDGRVRRGRKGGLEVDGDGLGEDWKGVKPDKVTVLDWFFQGRTERLQFFERADDWWACSANLLETTKGETPLRLLDANADGDYFDSGDLLSFGDGAFRPVGMSRVVDSGNERWALALDPGRGTPRLRFAVLDPFQEGTSAAQRKAFRTGNRLRNQHGFGPASFSPELSDALQLHTAYLHHHDPNKEGALKSYMGEEVGRALYSEAADAASRGGSVTYLTDRGDTEGHISSILNTTHSRLTLFVPGEARFGYGLTQAWSFMRTEQVEGETGAPFWALPGAGAKNVPTTCGRNWPYPQSYPTLYDEPRGLPISVQIPSPSQPDGTFLTVRTLGLTSIQDGARVGGFYFSIDDIPTGAMSNMWFFVPAKPLPANTEFLAQAVLERRRNSGQGDGILVAEDRFVWTFRTEN